MEATPKSAPTAQKDGGGGTDPIVSVVAKADYTIFSEGLADDVVFRSPVSRFRFRGRDITSTLFENLVKQSDLDRWRVEDFWNLGDAHLVALTTTVHGHQLDLLILTRMNERFQIREVTAYGRPMASIAIFPAFVYPRLVERFRGRGRSVLVRLLFRPLPRLLKAFVTAGLALGKPPQAEFEEKLPASEQQSATPEQQSATPEQSSAESAGPRSPWRRV